MSCDLRTVHPTSSTIVPSDTTPKVPFPWSAYLSQPLFQPNIKLILNPTEFRAIYQVQLLESCLRQLPAVTNYPRLRGY